MVNEHISSSPEPSQDDLLHRRQELYDQLMAGGLTPDQADELHAEANEVMSKLDAFGLTELPSTETTIDKMNRDQLRTALLSTPVGDTEALDAIKTAIENLPPGED